MSVFRVQRIRSCVQCGSVLGLKCGKCVKHPGRKLRVIELFDWPEILRTAQCGCCIEISCQLPGCKKTIWKYIRLRGKEKKSVARKLYCSNACAARAAGLSIKTRVRVPCAYCGKIVEKQQWALKLRNYVYCKQECHYLHVRQLAFDAKKDAREKENRGQGSLALLECWNGCKDITEHVLISEPNRGTTNYKYRCNVCKKSRSASCVSNFKEYARAHPREIASRDVYNGDERLSANPV